MSIVSDVRKRVGRIQRQAERAVLQFADRTSRSLRGRLYSTGRPGLPARPSARELYGEIEFQVDDPWLIGDEHPEHGLTARRVVAIFGEAEAGDPRQQAFLFDGLIKRDGHLHHCFAQRAESITGKEWLMVPGDDKPDSVAAATAMTDVLRDTNMQELFEHQLKAVAHGWSGTEIMWERRDGVTRPYWFKSVPHHQFVFDGYNTPRVLTQKAPRDGEELTPGKWVYSRMTGHRTASAGLMRIATWHSLFKTMGVRDWVVLLEKFGMPYITGTYADGTDDQTKRTMDQLVAAFGREGAAVFHESAKIVVQQFQNSDPMAHLRMADFQNSELSKLIKGSILTTEQGGIGSYAQAAVHADQSHNLVQADQQRLQEAFYRDVCRPFMVYNGLVGATPRLKIRVVRTVDPEQRMKQFVSALTELRLPLDADQVREEFDLKTPSGPKDTLMPPEPKAPASAPGDEGDEGDESDDEKAAA
jgi:phage gp29-like protein